MSRPARRRDGQERNPVGALANARLSLVNTNLGPAFVGEGELVAVVQQIEGTPYAGQTSSEVARGGVHAVGGPAPPTQLR